MRSEIQSKETIMKLSSIIMAGALALATGSPAWAQAAKPVSTAQFVTAQPAGEWLARVFLGAIVQNDAGETVGDINDLVFSPAGHISTVVLGVGGFLGMGEKDVAIPYGALSFKAGKDGGRVIVVALSKEALKLAPSFKATEKTTYDKVKDKAVDMGQKTVEKAVELKDQAAQKIEDMKKAEPVKK
jgi:PRC-barrel domain